MKKKYDYKSLLQSIVGEVDTDEFERSVEEVEAQYVMGEIEDFTQCSEEIQEAIDMDRRTELEGFRAEYKARFTPERDAEDRAKFFKAIAEMKEAEGASAEIGNKLVGREKEAIPGNIIDFPLSNELGRWISDFATCQLGAFTPAVYEFQEAVSVGGFGAIALSVIFREHSPGSFIFEATGANDEIQNLCLILVNESGEREPIHFKPTAVGGEAELIITKDEISGLQILLRRDEE